MSVELQERPKSKSTAEDELTDGFHLLIDALKLNDLNIIYGVPGIPITDFGRLAQANGHQGAVFPARTTCRQCSGNRRILNEKTGTLPDGIRTGFFKRFDGAGKRYNQLFPDDPVKRFFRA